MSIAFEHESCSCTPCVLASARLPARLGLPLPVVTRIAIDYVKQIFHQLFRQSGKNPFYWTPRLVDCNRRGVR